MVDNTKFFDVFYLILNIWFLVGPFCFLILCWYRLWKWIRQEYIDIFKLMQLVICIFYFSLVLTQACTYLANFSIEDITLVLYYISESCPFLYFTTDQLSWYVTIVQISELSKMKNRDIEYSEVKKMINKRERNVILLMVLLYAIVAIVVGITCVVSIAGKEQTSVFYLVGSKQLWYSRASFDAIYYSGLVISAILLYLKLTNIMKLNLSYHYQRNYKKLFILWLNSIVLFAGYVMASAFTIAALSFNIGQDDTTFWIFFLPFVFILNFTLYFVMFYNVYNINYQAYLQNVYFGFRILRRYPKASKFIIKSRWYRGEQDQYAISEQYMTMNYSSRRTEDHKNDDTDNQSQVSSIDSYT